jgi:hypothetical protein
LKLELKLCELNNILYIIKIRSATANMLTAAAAAAAEMDEMSGTKK